MFYSSYKEAHETLGIPGSFQRGTQGNASGISSLKLTANPLSLDKISDDFKTIWYVGIGKKSSQGHPAASQRKEDQVPFYVSLEKQNAFPVLLKIRDGLIIYAGNYKVRKIGLRNWNGIRYYEIELVKILGSR